MNPKFNKKILSALLTFVLLLGCMPVLTMAEGSTPIFAIHYEGEAVSQVTFARNEKPVVTAVNIPDGFGCQWQIGVPDSEMWVDIHGQQGESLTLTYALLGSLLDGEDSATVRCAAVSGSGEPVYTETVRVTVTEAAPVTQEQETTQAISSDSGLEAIASQFTQRFFADESDDIALLTEDSEDEGADALSDGDIVTITIQYLYWDRLTNTVGDMVWSPYIAYIERGTNFSATVANKTIPGYKAVLAENYAGATWIRNDTLEAVGSEYTGPTSIKLELTEVKEDITFTVYYKEILVNYYARYYLQNITNDLYTEDTSQYGIYQGYQGNQPDTEAVNKEITGFTSMFYQPDKIAADGSTVFEVYYDRNYYLINFDLGGGYGTAPVYARYQTTFTVAEPTRPGYVFAGWKLVYEDGVEVSDGTVSKTLPSTIPAHNQTYRAEWTKEATTYTVVYWLENANDDAYSYLTSSVIGADDNGDPDGTVKSGNGVSAADYSGNTTIFGDDEPYILYNEEKTLELEAARADYDSSTGKVIVAGDGSTVLNVYFDRKDYFIRFYYARSYVDSNNATIYQITTSTDSWSKRGNPYNDWTNAENEPLVAEGYETGYEELENDNTKYKYYYILLRAKYGQNIQDIWPAAPITNNWESGATDENGNSIEVVRKLVSWGVEYQSPYYYAYVNSNLNIKGPYAKMDSLLIYDNEWNETIQAYEAQTMIAYWNPNPKNWTYNIYVQLYENETTDENTVKSGISGEEKQYYLYKTFSVFSNEQSIDAQNAIAIEGFRFLGKEKEGEELIANFYYVRNDHRLYYRNYNKSMGDGSGAAVPYGKSLAIYDYFSKEDMETNYYPSDLEPNAYVFEGWYTTADFIPGTEMDWSGTMPDSDLTVYAKWSPVIHTVQFYLDYDALTADTLYGESVAPHGTVMTTPSFDLVPAHDNSNYSFVNWFYIKDGKKVAFEPSTMTVQQDLKLYAEWTSSQVTDYTVRYAKANEDGTLATDSDGNVVYIADPTTGYAFEATTRTFTAKPVEQLNLLPEGEKDQLWLPLTNSHSILMKTETDTYKNTFTFGYVTKENAPYTVRYVDSATGTVLQTKTVEQNKAAVVTEQFSYIEGYIPDAFYKQLVLSANEAENVITFYYTKDTTVDPEDPDTEDPDTEDTENPAQRTLYLVTHYIQDLDGEGYTEYKSETFIEDVGAYVTGTEITISGFTYMSDKTTATSPDGVAAEWDAENSGYLLGENGVELKLYYDRNTYSYTVHYLERGTDDVLQTAKNGEATIFGTVITEHAPTIAGYDIYSGTPQTLTIGTNESTNVITFYYVAKQVTINYVPVCTAAGAVNFGAVSRNVENPASFSDISGASAITRAGFRFVGWYSDAELTKQVATTKSYSPELPKNYAENDIYEFTYYALFEPVQEELIISKQAAAGTSLDNNDSFLFRVTGTDVLGNDVNLLVTIQGAGHVTITGLYCGTYTVTELTSWSWTYSCEVPEQKVTISSTDSETEYTVIFTSTPNTVDWLHGETYSEKEIN